MDFALFPILPAALLSVPGAAVFATLVGQYVKQWIEDERVMNLVVLVLAVLFDEVAAGIYAWQNQVVGADLGVLMFGALMAGFFGACLATFGYETVMNLLGKAGIGSRKD